jgi:hypothetical protein
MSLLVDLWIILFYLGNTENNLVVINPDHVQIDLFSVFSNYYQYNLRRQMSLPKSTSVFGPEQSLP